MCTQRPVALAPGITHTSRHPGTMDAGAQQLEAVLRQNFPDALCFACLSKKLTLPENELRDAAQMLVSPPSHFHVEPRLCAVCRRQGDMLTLDPLALTPGAPCQARQSFSI